MAVVAIIVICLIGLLVGSCFGIFFSGEDTGTGQTMRTAVQEINQEYESRLEAIKSGTRHDVLEMSCSRAVWPEVLAVYAVKATTDPDNAQEVASMDDSKKALLKDIFWQMNEISSRSETATDTVVTETDDGNGHIVQTTTTTNRTTLYIHVSHKTADEMADHFHFNADQRKQLAELLAEGNRSMWSAVLYGIGTGDGEIVTVALSQLGNVGGQPYWSWYGFGSRVEWCACFVSWCANECGYIDAGVIPKFAGCGMDGDGELRLTIMATLAQEESRKISERVRAGQKISRDNGVLYGNGNIIGYDRVGDTYVINEDQAETVRMIFDLYLNGSGEKKICNELCVRGRKDGHGNVSWSVSKISRILRNATYMGYKCYYKSCSNNYLEQKRIKNLDESSYLYVKGDFEPIVPEEIFKRCEEIRKSRTTKMVVNKGERTYGKRASQDVWLRKLRCKCGSSFRKNKWRTNKRGDTVYGYQCYNQVNNGSKTFREKNGLDVDGYCDIRMIGDWKLDLMAKMIFQTLWTDKKTTVLEAYRLLQECYQSDTNNNKAAVAATATLPTMQILKAISKLSR